MVAENLPLYLAAVTRASDNLRRSYYGLAITCGLLALFMLSGPFEAEKTLHWVNERKAIIDALDGEMNGLIDILERVKGNKDQESEVRQAIAKNESEKRVLLVDIQCRLNDTRDTCSSETEAALKSGSVSEEVLVARLDERRDDLQSSGVGLKIPILDTVVSARDVPTVTTMVLALLMAGLGSTAGTWRHAMQVLMEIERSRGLIEKPIRLTHLYSFGRTPSGRVARWATSLTLLAFHLVPSALCATSIEQQTGIFAPILDSSSSLLKVEVAGFTVMLGFIAWAGLAAALDLVAVRSLPNSSRSQHGASYG